MTETSQSTVPTPAPRREAGIFADLEALCSSPGYIHALAGLSWHANFIGYVDALHHKDFEKMHSHDRLLRSEITILTGLLAKNTVDTNRPSNSTIQEQIDKSVALLDELHKFMQTPMRTHISALAKGESADSPHLPISALREPIAYSGEAAYMFQYRDFALERYSADEAWFQQNAGFIPKDLHLFIRALSDLQLELYDNIRSKLQEGAISEPSYLPIFSFSPDAIVNKSGLHIDVVTAIIERFCINPPGNSGFTAFGHFNEATARPILPLGEGRFALLQAYSLAESFYDSPFFWMLADPRYKDASLTNRGLFTESFAAERLRHVLGADRVFQNVHIVDAKGNRAGEIDILAVYADRAVVVQAKSKKLTLAARRGEEEAIRDDFQKAVQDAYDQGLRCSQLLTDASYTLVSANGEVLTMRRDYAEIFVVCLVSECYPALAYQADQFLKQQPHGAIRRAYVIDIFFLDVLCEMLDTPLHFFSFLHRRLDLFHHARSESEMAVLSYHLVHNLWFDEEYDFVDLGGEFSTHLDAALLVRREGLPGEPTPRGILTKLQGTLHHRIAAEIGAYEADNVLDFGYYLLAMSETAAEEFSEACAYILESTAKDGMRHDFTLATGSIGITVHASINADAKTYEELYAHCEFKKYQQKADKWFGLAIWPGRSSITRMVLGLTHAWERSEEMDQYLAGAKLQTGAKTVRNAMRQDRLLSAKKPGRNDPCPCGSGVKYKKCCLRRG